MVFKWCWWVTYQTINQSGFWIDCVWNESLILINFSWFENANLFSHFLKIIRWQSSNKFINNLSWSWWKIDKFKSFKWQDIYTEWTLKVMLFFLQEFKSQSENTNQSW
jgi:hypothetical protein